MADFTFLVTMKSVLGSSIIYYFESVICGATQIENLIFEIHHPLLLDFELVFFTIIYCRFFVFFSLIKFSLHSSSWL